MRLQANRILLALTILLVPALLQIMWVVRVCFRPPESGSCGTSPLLVLLFMGSAVIGVSYLLLAGWLQFTTRFAEDGIHQRTVFGPKFLAWSEIAKVEYHDVPIVFSGGGTRIALYSLLFRNVGELDPVLRAHLPATVYPGNASPDERRSTTPPFDTWALSLQPNWGAIVVLSAIGISLGLLLVWMVVGCGAGVSAGGDHVLVRCGPTPPSPLLLLGGVVGAIYLLGAPLRQWLQTTTSVTEAGISQRTVRGRVFIPWRAVTGIETRGTRLVVRSADRQITISAGVFRNGRELRERLSSYPWPAGRTV
ncbi:MAG TPA: hypothetical protein VGO88_04730 [Mycetocola sp.]|nr:hypothetical protein [Mycetocola sp.]